MAVAGGAKVISPTAMGNSCNYLVPNCCEWIKTMLLSQEELEANIDDALHYYPVRLHLSVWIPGIILCLFSFIWKRALVILSSFSGAVLLVAVLLRNANASDSSIARLIDTENGNYCIGYWIALLLLF